MAAHLTVPLRFETENRLSGDFVPPGLGFGKSATPRDAHFCPKRTIARWPGVREALCDWLSFVAFPGVFPGVFRGLSQRRDNAGP
jgi:hypothetical protein